MGCGSCGQKYRGRPASRAAKLRGRRRMTEPTQPEVVVQQLVKQVTPVTEPAFGEIIPSNGMAKSIVETGSDPTNIIPDPLPPPATLVEVDANKSATGDEETVSTVTQAGGE